MKCRVYIYHIKCLYVMYAYHLNSHADMHISNIHRECINAFYHSPTLHSPLLSLSLTLALYHPTLGDLAGDNLTFLKRTISYANQHYPERSYVIYIVNAPFFFSMLWKMVKPMVHESTQKKVKILSARETLKGLQEHIDITQIPEVG
jgi:hypothetical protein